VPAREHPPGRPTSSPLLASALLRALMRTGVAVALPHEGR